MSDQNAPKKAKTAKKKHSIAEKNAAVEDIKSGRKTQADVAKEMKVSEAAVSKWVKGGHKLAAAVDAGRGSQAVMREELYPLVTKAILSYLDTRQRADAPPVTSWALLQRRALRIAQSLVAQGHKEYEGFRATAAWLSGVFKRHNYGRIQLHGTISNLRRSSPLQTVLTDQTNLSPTRERR